MGLLAPVLLLATYLSGHGAVLARDGGPWLVLASPVLITWDVMTRKRRLAQLDS